MRSLSPRDSKKTDCVNNTFDEKLLRLLVANIGDYAIFMLDTNGHILSWNQGAEK
jgi:PAS domain-containing protein